MIRAFVEAPAFTLAVKSQDITDEEVRDLQNDILAGRGTTIPGTGGVRKIRWGLMARGKSGGRRVLFADYEEFGLTLLPATYPKNVKENLTQGETNQWRRIKGSLDARIRERYGRKEK
jgi:hypothetical protein